MTGIMQKVETVIIVELCGKLADHAGNECRVAISSEGLSVAALKRAVAEKIPALGEALLSPRTKACVNDVIASDSATIMPEDRVALFPPVSGG